MYSCFIRTPSVNRNLFRGAFSKSPDSHHETSVHSVLAYLRIYALYQSLGEEMQSRHSVTATQNTFVAIEKVMFWKIYR